MSKYPEIIECPHDAALNDCAGCRTIDLCKEEIAYKVALKKTDPIVDAAICCSCPALKTKACEAFYPGGGWNPRAPGVKPCPGCLS